MSTTAFASHARQEKARHAADIDIDDALISNLVETFYAHVRADDLLGPIFEAHVADWPTHLGRMKDFWASMAIESGRFRGNPMLKHIAIGSLERSHFDRWLTLFSETLEEVVPRCEARDFFGERAARIADSLHMGIAIDRNGLAAVDRQSGKENVSC